MRHELKTWPEYFQAVIDGTKTFEHRVNDRDFALGDTLHLREWNPATRLYTGRETEVRVTYHLAVGGDGAPNRSVMAIVPLAQPAPGDVVERLPQPPFDLPELSDCPNLAAILNGTISGRFNEWPVVRPELMKLAAELRRLRAGVEAAKEGLREIERHHVERNGQVGRPEERSHTLSVVRTTLAKLEAP